ncbi:SIR2 family protein [Pseudoxanthomonas sp. Root65]|uniref:P-loop NTPase n=1 Tax=Pseudoxanthomonas sp. Root65 TaxID=1736576 RepID=UPI000A702D30|nr:SIR2 family protein [Pseudoxanthomonas sp. Root65]
MVHRIEAFGLSVTDAALVVRAAALGEYSLLLGAGFSLGAKNSAKKNLPTSKGLAEELKQEFSLLLDVATAADLPLAYEDAVYKVGIERVSSFLRRRLTGCSPSWHGVVSSIEWWRVWTLNIDDLISAVFATKKIREIDFKERYRVRNDQDGLQVVYLHGRALNQGSKVFSLHEYAEALRGEGYWHTAFFTEFKERPIIACGASLIGEVDLARTLRAKNESRLMNGTPSIAIVKDVDAASAERLRDRLGLIPIGVSGEDFFGALAADVADYVLSNPELLPKSVDPNKARAFGRQFRLLLADSPGRSPPRQDFYAGDEPLWSDIVSERDAVLSFSGRIVESLRLGLRDGSPAVGLYGDAGCGKTTTLLRVARELSPIPVYIFTGDDDVDVDACLECLSSRSAVLIFDEMADIGVAVSDLARKAQKRRLKIGVIFSDRSRRQKGLLPQFSDISSLTWVDHSELTPADAIAVIEKRRAAKRLGSMGSWPTSEIRKVFINKHHGSLLSSLSDVDIGNGFDARLLELAKIIDGNDDLRHLVFAISQTHRWGYPLPLHFASAVSGIPSEVIVKYCLDDGVLSDILFVERRGIRFRHRILAERVFERNRNFDLMAAVARDLVAAISPVVNIQAIQAKSYAHRICKVLMERRSVYATLGGDIDKARDWYGSVEPFFGWNSRFWEQRALLELEAYNYSAAYSFSRAAVDKERHAFPLTTFGTTCLIIAGHRGEYSLDEAFKFYKEGEAALQLAMVEGRFQPETLLKPVETFFLHAERLWPLLSQRPDMRRRVQDDWRQWLRHAEDVGYFRHKPELEAEYQGWLLKTALK